MSYREEDAEMMDAERIARELERRAARRRLLREVWGRVTWIALVVVFVMGVVGAHRFTDFSWRWDLSVVLWVAAAVETIRGLLRAAAGG